MSYPWKTAVAWTADKPTLAERAAIDTQLVARQTQNKTTGAIESLVQNQDGTRTVTRSWDSQASAQDWISNVVGPFNPVSAVVIAPT